MPIPAEGGGAGDANHGRRDAGAGGLGGSGTPTRVDFGSGGGGGDGAAAANSSSSVIGGGGGGGEEAEEAAGGYWGLSGWFGRRSGMSPPPPLGGGPAVSAAAAAAGGMVVDQRTGGTADRSAPGGGTGGAAGMRRSGSSGSGRSAGRTAPSPLSMEIVGASGGRQVGDGGEEQDGGYVSDTDEDEDLYGKTLRPTSEQLVGGGLGLGLGFLRFEFCRWLFSPLPLWASLPGSLCLRSWRW